MIDRRDVQVVSVINALSRVVFVDPILISKRTKNYPIMSDAEVMKDLYEIVYEYCKDDTDLCEYFFSLINNINLEIAPSVEEIKEEYEGKNVKEDNHVSLEENHKLIIDTFTQITNMFNIEGIDYCVIGSLPAYIQNGVPLFRYHSDIDIMINEEDIEKVKMVMENCGFTFTDLRFPSLDEFHTIIDTKNTHLVTSTNVYNGMSVDFVTFRREKDNSITTTDYLQREYNGEVIVDRLERNYNPIGTHLRFDNRCECNGVLANVCSTEHVYNLKSVSRREKDLTDMEVLAEYIDKDKLKEIRRNNNTKQIVRNVRKEDEMTM